MDYSKRRQTLIAKYGSEEAVREHYREMQRKSREKYRGTGGFAYLKKHDLAKLKEISAKGNEAQRNSKDETVL